VAERYAKPKLSLIATIAFGDGDARQDERTRLHVCAPIGRAGEDPPGEADTP
jgi:hypothetical protein